MIKKRRVFSHPPRKIAKTEGSTVSTIRFEPYDRLVIIKEFDLKVFAPVMEFVVREIQTLMKINHPNLVKLLEIWPEEQIPTLIMEHAGDNLWDFSKSVGRFHKIAYFPRIFGQIFSGLDYMHKNNIIHRDIKSKNILVRMNDRVVPSDPIVKLCDFGLSRLIAVTMTPGTATPNYRSPEILSGDDYDEKLDIWAMGCVIYEYIEYQELFEGTTDATIRTRIHEFLKDPTQITWLSKPSRHAKSQQPLIDIIVSVLQRTLSKDPNDRPTAGECLAVVNSQYEVEMRPFLLMRAPQQLLRKTLTVDLNIRHVVVVNMLEMDKYYEVSRETLALAVELYDKWLMTTDGSEDLILHSLAAVVLASYMSTVLDANEFASVYEASLILDTVKNLFRSIGYDLYHVDLWTSMQQIIKKHQLAATDDHMEFYWQRVCELLSNYESLFAKSQEEINILLDQIIA